MPLNDRQPIEIIRIYDVAIPIQIERHIGNLLS